MNRQSPPRAPRRLPNNTRWNQEGLGELAHRRGYTLEALAAETGYTVWHLRFVFVGRRLPTVELLLRLRRVLKASGDELLTACASQIRRHLAA